jgi:hypothetical protein
LGKLGSFGETIPKGAIAIFHPPLRDVGRSLLEPRGLRFGLPNDRRSAKLRAVKKCHLGLRTRLSRELRRAMVDPSRFKLGGMVEIDEAYVGGLEEGSPGREADKKALNANAVEIKEGRPGSVKMAVIDSAAGDNLFEQIKHSK